MRTLKDVVSNLPDLLVRQLIEKLSQNTEYYVEYDGYWIGVCMTAAGLEAGGLCVVEKKNYWYLMVKNDERDSDIQRGTETTTKPTLQGEQQ